jgi:hypothetical protein
MGTGVADARSQRLGACFERPSVSYVQVLWYPQHPESYMIWGLSSRFVRLLWILDGPMITQ